MDRQQFNTFAAPNVLNNEKMLVPDYQTDKAYEVGKARDIFKKLSNPPYITDGLLVSQNVNPLLVNITAGTGFDGSFMEVNGQSTVGYPMFNPTSGVINYLTLQYQTAPVPGSTRHTFLNPTISYPSRIQDSFRYQWKLAAPIRPEQLGSVSAPYDIITDVNDQILFQTDQGLAPYAVTITQNAASLSSLIFASGSVVITQGVNDTLNYIVDGFTYSAVLTVLPSESVTLATLCTRINTQAFAQNSLLMTPLAYVISGQNKIRITSPRDTTPVPQKQISILIGNANQTFGFSGGIFVQETPKKSAQNIVDQVNFVSTPETTAAVQNTNQVILFAQNPAGTFSILPVLHDAYSTIGFTPVSINGAQQIDFANDILLAAVTQLSGAAQIDYTLRSPTVKLFDLHTGWKYQSTVTTVSGNPDDLVVTIPNGSYYIAGNDELEVYVQGVYQYIGKGFDEIGPTGGRSTQFIVYGVISGETLLYTVPPANAASQKQISVERNGNIITVGTQFFDFGEEFLITDVGENTVNIQLQILSGDPTIGSGVVLANHGFLHEFGGSMEISVDNLSGLLRFPQKTLIEMRGTPLANVTALNFVSNQFEISLSGTTLNLDLPDNVFVDDTGDAIIRLGLQGLTIFPYITLVDQLSNPWTVTVSNAGQLISQQQTSGVPLTVILESSSGNLFVLGIDNVIGSGNITTTQVTSGVPLNFGLQAPNGGGWGVKIRNDGVLFTTAPDNIFQIQNNSGAPIYTVDDEGIVFFNIFNPNAASGSLDYLPDPTTKSGGIALFNRSGTLDILISDGIQWEQTFIAQKNVFTQALPLASWSFNHTLGTSDYSVTTKDLSGNIVIPNNVNCGASTVTVSFTLPQTGKVVLIG